MCCRMPTSSLPFGTPPPRLRSRSLTPTHCVLPAPLSSPSPACTVQLITVHSRGSCHSKDRVDLKKQARVTHLARPTNRGQTAWSGAAVGDVLPASHRTELREGHPVLQCGSRERIALLPFSPPGNFVVRCAASVSLSLHHRPTFPGFVNEACTRQAVH